MTFVTFPNARKTTKGRGGGRRAGVVGKTKQQCAASPRTWMKILKRFWRNFNAVAQRLPERIEASAADLLWGFFLHKKTYNHKAVCFRPEPRQICFLFSFTQKHLFYFSSIEAAHALPALPCTCCTLCIEQPQMQRHRINKEDFCIF